MRFSVFEEAAAEASQGARQIDAQMEQMKAQLVRLRGKRDLLETLMRQLVPLRPTSANANPPNGTPAAAPGAGAPPMFETSADGEAEMKGGAGFPPPRPIRSELWPAYPSDDSVSRERA